MATKEACPKCGEMYDPEKSALFECRECGVVSSDNCCNAGAGTLCFDCEEMETEEDDDD